jgi:eukaryotic-like serine/threonine-protein kinase
MFGFGKKREDDGKSLTQPLPQDWQVADLGLLGSGGMARVYKVRDEVLGREVALKVLRPELAKAETAAAGFVNEARITAQLDHPNIPAVYALANDKKSASAFTMKLLEGQTLQQLIDENEREDVDGISAAVEVLLRICDAVAFAHSKGVLHLDLKPSNVIVAPFGQIYLVDWGIARRKAELPTGPIEVKNALGTPNYMPPEQAKGEQWKFDERTDIYALGGVLYRALAGRAPHASSTGAKALEKAATGIVTPPDTVPGRAKQVLPRRLVSICMKALSPDPERRYQTVQAFQHDLERYARGLAQLPQRHFKAGEAIISEGEPGDAAYVIIDGECVATRGAGAEAMELRRLSPGELFGEAAVFTGQARSATVTAVVDTVVGVVDQAALREEMERTSFMSLAIRTVSSTFLDLDRQMIKQRKRSQVIEQTLRHFLNPQLEGSTPWRSLLEQLMRSSGASEEEVSSWVLGAKGFSLEGEALVLNEPEAG